MLGYVTIGTSDMAKATAFYDALLAEIGAKQLFGQDRIKFYGTGPGAPMVAMNAGAALYVAGQADSLSDGVEKARAILTSGRALARLEAFAKRTQVLAGSQP